MLYPDIRDKIRMASHHLPRINTALIGVPNAVRQKEKSIQIRKKELKLFLFANMIIYIEKPKEINSPNM